MSDAEDLVRRVRELEEENRRLRSRAGGGGEPVPVTTHVGMFKGKPVITFEGPFRPFTFGVKKASLILERIADVKHFVENNKHHMTSGDADLHE